MVWNVKMKDDGSLFLILPLFCVSLCLLCVRYTSNSSNKKILRNLSIDVYLIQSPLEFVKYVFIFITRYTLNGIVHFTFISLIAICICLLSYRSKN